MKKCPFCAEDIQDAAVVCKHCGRDIKITRAGGGAFWMWKESAQPAVAKPRTLNSALVAVLVIVGASMLILAVTIVYITFFQGPFEERAVSATTTRASRSSTPTSTPSVPAAQESVEYKLAVLNHGGYVAHDDVTVARFRSLLQQLALKFGETPQNVGNMSVKCRNALLDKGISESILNIMEGMNQIVDRPGSYGKDPYANFLTLYIVLRTSGKSHQFAIDNLRGVIRELGLK